MDTIEPDGIPGRGAEGWRKKTSEEFYVNRKPLLKALDPLLEGLFCAHDVREVDPTLEWKSNLVELMRQGEGLAGLEAIARIWGTHIQQEFERRQPLPLEKTSERESQTGQRKFGEEHV